MFKLTAILCFSLAFSATPLLYGQTLTSAVYTNPEIQLDIYQDGKNKAILLTQQGDGNVAHIKQVSDYLSQTQLVRALQEGDLNKIAILNSGGNIRTDVFQTGTANQYNSVVFGQSNTSLVIQNGVNNTVHQELNNASSIRSEFIQNGNANQVQQTLENVHSQQFKLIQNGNGLRAVIVQRG